ncbi:MAG: hypothetical protein EA416_01530 [Trueperaceae bacterium]|nr:MAG: hypothetical protein EA416_01530 [Trueperaceae bacterium]
MRRQAQHPSPGRAGGRETPALHRVHRLALVLSALALVSVVLAQAAPIAGTFADDRVTLSLRAIGGGQYTGTIAIDGSTYQLSATGSPDRVEGAFVAGGSSFGFQAEVVGDVLTLVSGASRYTLVRQGGTAAQAQPQASPPAAAAQRAIQRGTRLSYDHAAVSHAGTNAGPDVRSVGGRGITRFTVLHIDDRTCVMSMTMFMEAASGGHWSLQPFSGGTLVSRDGTCPEVWWPPERLATYAAPPGSVEQVHRGPFQFESGGHTFDALYVRQELAGTRYTRVWDLASGVALSNNDGTGPVQVPAPEPTSSSYMILLDVRTATYPWDLHTPLPANVQALAGVRIDVSVSQSFVGANLPPHVERFQAVFDVAERFQDLLLLRVRGSSGDDGYSVLSPDGNLFVPPTAIAQLRPGQRLDEDPITGGVLSVERVDGAALVLAIDGPGLAVRRTYDAATGLQRSERLEMNDGINHVVIETTVSAIQ